MNPARTLAKLIFIVLLLVSTGIVGYITIERGDTFIVLGEPGAIAKLEIMVSACSGR